MKTAGAQEETVEGWREARRSRILAAATTLFANRGFADVQMDDVARLAGMGKPTLYRYFPSKAELFLAAFDGLLDGIDVRLQEIASSGRSPHQQVAEMIDALVGGLADQIATLPYLEGESPDLAGRWRVAYRRRRRQILGRLQTVLEAGVAAGEFAPLDTEVIPALIMGMVRGGLTGAQVPVDRIAAGIKALVLGLRP
ncbi:TetR/AcrR family transcriptional regulator [Ferrovibrio xuzhouensis]|uniref:TetR/AcrR family transcriptional regulator n=1 Tax=Ferrovibrio xuzhouensis TaxID=1576914 RepID=A0ABV7VKW4_9PROT